MKYPSDHAAEQSGHGLRQALADLDRAYTAAPPPRLRETMDSAVYARMAASTVRRPSPVMRGRRLARTRLVPLAAALLLALSGVAGYLRLQTPATASAQVILHRAAAVLRLAPDQVAHATYSVAVSAASSAKGAGGLTGTADVWVQADASGVPTRSAQTLTTAKAGTYSRFIQIGSHSYAYNPELRGDNVIVLDGTRGRPSWLLPADVFDGASVTQQLSALAAQSPQRVQLLPQQTLDGHAVDVIEVDGWINRPAQRTIFYFDAQSYALRGFDASSLDPSYAMPTWQARLLSATSLPAAAVPPGTFTLNAPATAQVARPDLGDPAAFQTLLAAYASACHSGADTNLKALLRYSQSLLAACQASAPGMTEDNLVAALAAPGQASLDAAVAAGQLTPAQSAASLAALQAWLSTWLATPGGQGT